MNFGFGWDYGTQGATILQVGLMLEVLFMRSKTKCFLNLFFCLFCYRLKALYIEKTKHFNNSKISENMNKIKQTLVVSYRILTIAVTIIEAADLGKTIYGKYKNKKSVKPTTPTDTANVVETVCE